MDGEEDYDEEYEIDDEDDEAVIRFISAPFSWLGLASDTAIMASTVFHALGKLAFDTAINLGQAHNLRIDRRSGEQFAQEVLDKVRALPTAEKD